MRTNQQLRTERARKRKKKQSWTKSKEKQSTLKTNSQKIWYRRLTQSMQPQPQPSPTNYINLCTFFLVYFMYTFPCAVCSCIHVDATLDERRIEQVTFHCVCSVWMHQYLLIWLTEESTCETRIYCLNLCSNEQSLRVKKIFFSA